MTPEQLVAATGCTLQLAKLYAEPLAKSLPACEITKPLRVIHFLANAAHESDQFDRVEEQLDYRAVRLLKVWPKRFPSMEFAKGFEHNPVRLANYVYANRNGNGGVDSGDGWKFRGRGWGQLTFRANYVRYTMAFPTAQAVSDPDVIKTPFHAVNSFAWYWKNAGCNALADADDAEGVRAAINGPAKLGMPEVLSFIARAKAVLL